MQPENNGSDSRKRLIKSLQLIIIFGFSGFAAAIILWIGRLIYVSWELNDTISGSIAIAVVAGGVFIVLTSVFHYLFWGLRKSAKQVGGR